MRASKTARDMLPLRADLAPIGIAGMIIAIRRGTDFELQKLDPVCPADERLNLW